MENIDLGDLGIVSFDCPKCRHYLDIYDVEIDDIKSKRQNQFSVWIYCPYCENEFEKTFEIKEAD